MTPSGIFGLSWLCADISVQQVAVSAAVEFGARRVHHALLIQHLPSLILKLILYNAYSFTSCTARHHDSSRGERAASGHTLACGSKSKYTGTSVKTFGKTLFTMPTTRSKQTKLEDVGVAADQDDSSKQDPVKQKQRPAAKASKKRAVPHNKDSEEKDTADAAKKQKHAGAKKQTEHADEEEGAATGGDSKGEGEAATAETGHADQEADKGPLPDNTVETGKVEFMYRWGFVLQHPGMVLSGSACASSIAQTVWYICHKPFRA